jgi:hypothetical protein
MVECTSSSSPALDRSAAAPPQPNTLRQRRESTTQPKEAGPMSSSEHSSNKSLAMRLEDDLCYPAFAPPPLRPDVEDKATRRQQKLLMAEARNRNAFFFDPRLSILEKIQYILLWIPLIPVIRVVLVIFLVLTTLLYCSVVMWLPQRMQV